MLAAGNIAIVTYDLHEPYEYSRLWEILRAEGLDNHVISDDGRHIELPMSVWAKTLPVADTLAARDHLSDTLTYRVQAAGLNARLMIMICDGWAWRITNPKATPTIEQLLSAVFSKHHLNA